jgi:lipopolysaccharide export system permease protein
MIKKIDWYIIRKFLGTFVFIIALLMSITIVIDLAEKIDNFLDNSITFWEVVSGYYVYFIPYMAALLGPFFVLVAVIFFTSQLAGRSEIIAILNSGTSFYRFLYPYFIAASFLVVVFYIGNNYIVPYSNDARIRFEKKYINKGVGNISYKFHRRVAPGTIVFIDNYKPSKASGYNFSIDHFEKGKLVYKLRSERVEWLPREKKWRVFNYYTRQLNPKGDIIKHGTILDTTFAFVPGDFDFNDYMKDAMTTPELNEHIDYMYKSGQTYIEFFEVEKYRRTSSAFCIYIMTLIGVSVASRKERGGMGWNVVLGIGLSAAYEIIMKFSITFSTNSSLPPILGVWIPNIIFGILAIYLLRRAQR